MPQQPAPDTIAITSLRGGMNDVDPPHLLPDDQCVLAQNVEFYYSSIGERRLGCEPVSLTGSGVAHEAAVVHLTQRYPTNDIKSPEYWVIGATPSTSVTISRGTPSNWVDVVPTDAVLSTPPAVYEIDTQPLHGKLFFAYPSGQDRLHVWDGTHLRRTGLAQPAAPAVPTDTGSGSYAAILRYYRVRYIEKQGATIVRRSEPSTSVAFTPSGSGSGAVVTKPAAITENETHWELEVSLDNALFYVLATTLVGTTTVTDSTVTTSYSAGVLSEDIGAYLNLSSLKYVAVDQDRLIGAGHQTDLARQSQIVWTPVNNDPGVGNDERLPLSVNNTVNLDNNDGGALTGIGMTVAGVGYAFKWSIIYSIIRTNDPTRAYDIITLTRSRGAIPGSIVPGVDATGSSCLYFLDPVYGPARIGPGGMEFIRGFRATWKRVNTSATQIAARGVYYPNKQQVHWFVAADGSNTPTLKLVLQADAVQEGGSGVGPVSGRGWSIATGRITNALCAAIFTETEIVDGLAALGARPFIGLTAPDLLQRCDTQDTDAGQAYVATILTRPYLIAGLLSDWGVLTGTLLAFPNASKTVVVSLIRDFGREQLNYSVPLTQKASETLVICDIDNLAISSATALQIKFSDTA